MLIFFCYEYWQIRFVKCYEFYKLLIFIQYYNKGFVFYDLEKVKNRLEKERLNLIKVMKIGLGFIQSFWYGLGSLFKVMYFFYSIKDGVFI